MRWRRRRATAGRSSTSRLGDTHYAIAAERQLRVADAVSLEGLARAVKRVSVQLDYELGLPPHSVHLQPGHQGIDGRRWQALLAAQVEEAKLQIRARSRWGRARLAEDRAQHAQTMATAAAQPQLLQRADVEQLAALGLLEGAFDAPRRQNLREVEECAGERGRRDSAALRAVLGMEPPRAVHGDPMWSTGVAR